MPRPQPQLGLTTESVNLEELYIVISGAASQDVTQLQACTERLKTMMDMTGTFDGLSDIASQKTSVPLAVRQQSIIQFKNHAPSHWRSRKLLTDEARARIRSRCLMMLDEEDDLIAQCNEEIISKIARSDFPGNWSNLVTDLMTTIETNLQTRYSTNAADPRTTLVLRRSIKALNGVIHEFTTVRMLTGVATLKNLFTYLHQPLWKYYETISSSFASTLNPNSIALPRTAEDLLLAHLLYEAVFHLATWLWQRHGKDSKDDFEGLRPWFNTVFQNSGVVRKNLNESRTNIMKAVSSSATPLTGIGRQSIGLLTRHLILLGEFFRRLQQLSSPSFVRIPSCTDIVLYGWSKVVEATNAAPQLISDSEDAVFPTKVLVQAMVLFKESLGQWTEKPKKGLLNPDTLSREFVEEAVKLLVTKFIPLNPKDLEGWMADPEEWVNLEDKENDQWEYDLRPCGERVLMTLCQQYTSFVVPLLETTFKQVIDQPTVDLASVVQKEALYCAIGRCALKMKNVIPFDQWLQHSLIPESHSDNPTFPIIKRRIAWLIGQWVHNGCSSADNPRIWEVLVHLLEDRGPGADAVVRFTAATAMKECVDSPDFDINVFAPFLARAVTELVRLTEEADTLESKHRVARCLDTIIDRAEIRIIPLIPLITLAIPQYWIAAEDDFTFKATLLGLVECLVKACKEHSATLCALTVPLIRDSLSPKNITSLDEQGLDLWQSTLRNTVTIESVNGAPALADLVPLLLQLLAVNLDLLGKIIGLVESYFILGAPLILKSYALDFFRATQAVLTGPAVSVNIRDTTIALNLVIQITHPSQWAEAIHVSGLFAHIIGYVLNEESPAVQTTQFLYVLARIIIADSKIFMQLLSATASSTGAPDDSKLVSDLMDVWWARFDNMAEPRQRKLTAMCIASLVSTGHPQVLKRLSSEVFNLWMDVFCEIQEVHDQAASDGTSSPIHRFWDEDQAPSSYYKETEGTPEWNRRHTLFTTDPVRTTLLSTFVAARLQEAEVACGGPQALQQLYLHDVDPTVMKQIQVYLSKS